MRLAAGGARAAGPPRTAAVIDVGSNSVLLLVVALHAHGRARAVDEALATTRLGSGLAAGGRLDDEACARTRAAVVDFAARARAAGASDVWAFGTGALRDAADGRAFAAELATAADAPVEVLAGAEEARLAYLAARGADGVLLAVDVGGRTTELTLGRRKAILASVSLPLGALALTETFVRIEPAAATAWAALRAAVDAGLAGTDVPARARGAGAALAASGGTATALAALDLGLDVYRPARVHGHVLSALTVAALADRLAALSVAARAALPALDPGRAAILPAGAFVLAAVATAAGAGAVRISDHGVRHAYLRERLAGRGVRADLSQLWP